jgi:S1-C subfamily serine protease
MRGSVLAFALLLLAGARAVALFGDAAPAEWTTARPAVIVFGSRGLCSGVVLAQDLVLTAAHCVIAATDVKIVGHIAAAPFHLADVTQVAPHPQFSAVASPTADLALLKLSKPLPIGFAPAFLDSRPIAVGDRLIVVGYGMAMQGDGKSAGTPRMATLVVTHRWDRLLTLRDASGGAISGCGGDSGAPAFAIRGGVPALVGVVTKGACGGSALATSATSASTIVIPFAPYRDWILETARQFGSPLDP